MASNVAAIFRKRIRRLASAIGDMGFASVLPGHFDGGLVAAGALPGGAMTWTEPSDPTSTFRLYDGEDIAAVVAVSVEGVCCISNCPPLSLPVGVKAGTHPGESLLNDHVVPQFPGLRRARPPDR